MKLLVSTVKNKKIISQFVNKLKGKQNGSNN